MAVLLTGLKLVKVASRESGLLSLEMRLKRGSEVWACRGGKG